MTDKIEKPIATGPAARSWRGRKRLGHWLLWPGLIAFFVGGSIESGGIVLLALGSVMVGFILVVEARAMRWWRRE